MPSRSTGRCAGPRATCCRTFRMATRRPTSSPTKTLESIPEELRGTYAGLASDEAIEHLTSLGVTAVELLPIHQIVDEMFLVDKGLRNYWGYSSIGYFAPHSEY